MQRGTQRFAVLLIGAAAAFSLGRFWLPAAMGQQGPERIDRMIREDFFAGLGGDRARFDRAMKFAEETLGRNPKHGEALVWHGSGLHFLAGQAFRSGDEQKGRELRARGLKEMADGVALEPDSVSTRIPRAATLLASARYVPESQAAAMLKTAMTDYERTLEIQSPYFGKLCTHAKGELLAALAEGWHRLGEQDKSRGYLRRMTAELPGSPYEKKAKVWLENPGGIQKQDTLTCQGCHQD